MGCTLRIPYRDALYSFDMARAMNDAWGATASAPRAPGKRDVEGGGEKSGKGSSEAGTKLCLAALTRVVKERPEDDGSAQPVGGHGLVGHQCGRDERCARELAGSKSGRAGKCRRTC